MAWLIESRLECPRCGTRRDEWHEDEHAYAVDVYRCPGCELIDVESGEWRKEGGNQGIHMRLVRPDQLPPIMIPGEYQ